MQKDGIWEIEHSEKLNLKVDNTEDVKKKLLLKIVYAADLKHFSALDEKVGFAVADTFETFMNRVV